MAQSKFFWGRVTRDSFYFPGAKIDGSLYFLSNFCPCRFELDGHVWRSTEHYFQAMKFAKTDPDYFQVARDASSAAKAAALGRSRKHPIDPKWDENRDEVMLAALRAKFGQNPSLRTKLRDTGSVILHEDAKHDFYWGVGRVTKPGQDKLGKMLMKVRREL